MAFLLASCYKQNTIKLSIIKTFVNLIIYGRFQFEIN